MKQHITREQWQELTPDQYQKFTELFPVNGEYPTIGQMIEFLHGGENDLVVVVGKEIKKVNLDKVTVPVLRATGEDAEIADLLWDACKIKLNLLKDANN